MSKKIKKALAVLGFALMSLPMVPAVHAGIIIDSAGKNMIDSAQDDVKEIGGATIVLCAMAWGIKKARSI